jgi:hypothetical protein
MEASLAGKLCLSSKVLSANEVMYRRPICHMHMRTGSVNVGGMHRGYHGVCTLKFLGFHGAENKNPLKCWKVFNSKHRKQGLYFDLCFVASWNLFSPFPFLIVPKNSRHMVWMELITSCLWEWALTGLSQTAPHL